MSESTNERNSDKNWIVGIWCTKHWKLEPLENCCDH